MSCGKVDSTPEFLDQLLFIVRRADTSKIPIEKPAVFHTSSTAGTGIIPRAEPKGNVPRTDPDPAGTQRASKFKVKFKFMLHVAKFQKP